MSATLTNTAALYAEGHRLGAEIVRQHGLAQAWKALWAIHHLEHPMNPEAGEYAAGLIDALEDAIREEEGWQCPTPWSPAPSRA